MLPFIFGLIMLLHFFRVDKNAVQRNQTYTGSSAQLGYTIIGEFWNRRTRVLLWQRNPEHYEYIFLRWKELLNAEEFTIFLQTESESMSEKH